MYQPPSFTTRLTLLAAAASAASAIPLQDPQQHPSFFHIQTGPITFHIHPPPLAPPPEPSLDARLGRGTIVVIVVAVLLVQYVLYTISRWLRDHLSPVVHGQRVVRAGRSSAVSLGDQPRPPSPTKLHALSAEANASENVLPLPEAALPAESTTLRRRTLSVVWAEPGPPCDADPPNETSSLLKNNYTPPAYHGRGDEHALTTEAGIHPEACQASPSGPSTSGNAKTPSYDDEPSPSTSHPAPHKRPSLNKSLDGGLVPFVISSIIIAAFGLDWAGTDAPLPGVALDLEWLKKICSDSAPFITLSTLHPHNFKNITAEIVRLKVLDIFKSAEPGTAIVLYFNGHGKGNSFLLCKDSIDAATLIGWILAIRAETKKRNPVYIVFEHCRLESSGQPSLDLGQDIHILYSCMPGQQSADFSLAGDNDAHVPCSNFLKACCLLLAEARTRPIISVGDLMSRMNVWMEKVVRMMRAEECRMSKCPSPCVVCPCLSLEHCVHPVTRARHGIAEAYPRIQNPDPMFWGVEARICPSELFELPEHGAGPFLDQIQKTAERIKEHEIYRLLDDKSSFAWLALLWSILVSVLNSVLRFLTPNQPELAVGSVPNPGGQAGESKLFQPAGSTVQRGRDMGTVAVLVAPLPL